MSEMLILTEARVREDGRQTMPEAKIYTAGTVEPGWTTTEFYQTLIVHVIAAVVAIGTLFKADFNLDGVQAIAPSAALAAATIAQVVYSLSRSKVKASASAAVAAVDSAPAATTNAAPAAQAEHARPSSADPSVSVVLHNFGALTPTTSVTPSAQPTSAAPANSASSATPGTSATSATSATSMTAATSADDSGGRSIDVHIVR